jgi:hypothetical protein
MRATRYAAILLLVLATAGFADILVGTDTTNYGWIPGWTANGNGHPYWDNPGDAPGDVGQCLATPSLCMAGAPGVIPYWGRLDNGGDAGGSADMRISFQRTASESGAALRLEIAGNAGGKELGWYNIDGYLIQLHPIFTVLPPPARPPCSRRPRSTASI